MANPRATSSAGRCCARKDPETLSPPAAWWIAKRRRGALRPRPGLPPTTPPPGGASRGLPRATLPGKRERDLPGPRGPARRRKRTLQRHAHGAQGAALPPNQHWPGTRSLLASLKRKTSTSAAHKARLTWDLPGAPPRRSRPETQLPESAHKRRGQHRWSPSDSLAVGEQQQLSTSPNYVVTAQTLSYPDTPNNPTQKHVEDRTARSGISRHTTVEIPGPPRRSSVSRGCSTIETSRRLRRKQHGQRRGRPVEIRI